MIVLDFLSGSRLTPKHDVLWFKSESPLSSPETGSVRNEWHSLWVKEDCGKSCASFEDSCWYSCLKWIIDLGSWRVLMSLTSTRNCEGEEALVDRRCDCWKDRWVDRLESTLGISCLRLDMIMCGVCFGVYGYRVMSGEFWRIRVTVCRKGEDSSSLCGGWMWR